MTHTDDYGFECFIPEESDLDEDELVAGNTLQDEEDRQAAEDVDEAEEAGLDEEDDNG